MAMQALQSKDHRDLLDMIDKLRSKGISRYVDLPEIIVCGDQSAGKSSVLEAISGMSFPTKDSLCTRFPTELVLRRQEFPAVKVSITPGPKRSAEERVRLSAFRADVDIKQPDLGSVIEKAKDAMGISNTRVFSSDSLRVELCGPSQPHLTLVDLPGLFQAGNKEQSVNDAEIVRQMVRSYVKRPRSIILAVVSAKSEFALQEITELARKLDPDRVRTLGLVTKPDTLDVGSQSESDYLRLIQNKNVKLRLGWHVLKNRDFKMRDATSAERDEAEAAFFAKGAWAALDPSLLGVKTLKPRLSNVLKQEILRQLPSLLQDIDSEMSSCTTQLQLLGTPRSTMLEQRRYLLQVSRDFTSLMKAAVNGEYSNSFFGSAKTNEGYRRRLRARVQNALVEFEKDMRLNGQSRVIVDHSKSPGEEWSSKNVLRSEYVEEVKLLMSRSRARELPGTFNPLIIGELFAEQCQPWESIAAKVEDNIMHIVHDVTKAIVDHVTVSETARGILSVIDSSIEELKTELGLKFNELLAPHRESHPITYNHYLTDTVQKLQSERRRREIKDGLKRYLGVTESGLGDEKRIQPIDLLASLASHVEVDMERVGSELAIDYMLAYYKVAIKKFVDDVSILAVEHCLINKLPSLFESDIIIDLKDSEISQLATESEGTADQRKEYAEKLDILADCRTDLRRMGVYWSADTEAHTRDEDKTVLNSNDDISMAGNNTNESALFGGPAAERTVVVPTSIFGKPLAAVQSDFKLPKSWEPPKGDLFKFGPTNGWPNSPIATPSVMKTA